MQPQSFTFQTDAFSSCFQCCFKIGHVPVKSASVLTYVVSVSLSFFRKPRAFLVRFFSPGIEEGKEREHHPEEFISDFRA